MINPIIFTRTRIAALTACLPEPRSDLVLRRGPMAVAIAELVWVEKSDVRGHCGQFVRGGLDHIGAAMGPRPHDDGLAR